MPDVRYVILSDLHFGAENSILTALADVADPLCRPHQAIAGHDCLRGLPQGGRGANEGPSCRRWCSQGTCSSLRSRTTRWPAAVFEQFTDLVVGDHPLFADEIWFVPGNHDHHLWETVEGGPLRRSVEGAVAHCADTSPDTRHGSVPEDRRPRARGEHAQRGHAAAAQDHKGAHAGRLPQPRSRVS